MVDFISLSELNILVKKTLAEKFTQSYKIVAEISEINENRGHAYLELTEKQPETDKLAAKARAVIWASFYRMIKPYFRSITGSDLEAGMKILISVSVEFHEIYGYSLNINDIDPTYTLGELERRRIQIIKKLEEDGVIDMNKEIDFPLVPQRIAVISSETAAGYGDFMNQIQNNEFGYAFRIKLFPALMQGENAQYSVIEALDSIYKELKNFDIVVIVRGGGSKFDLSCFDDYDLALNIAQFPLPVITGIGHERDSSIADITAHTTVKTPTAAAVFLISKIKEFDIFLQESVDILSRNVKELTFTKLTQIQKNSMLLKSITNTFVEKEKFLLSKVANNVRNKSQNRISIEKYFLEKYPEKIKNSSRFRFQNIRFVLERKKQNIQESTKLYLSNAAHKVELLQQRIESENPQNILKLGYSMTLLNGKLLKNSKDVKKGDVIETRVQNGKFESEVL